MPPTGSACSGQGSILTVTSQANRTSPVLRGKWVLDNILGAPVPPPPPNVPPLKPEDDDGDAADDPRGAREAPQPARSAPTATRAWIRGASRSRTSTASAPGGAMDGGKPIDTTSALLDGTKLDGPAGVRQVLLARSDQFVSTVTEKLMVYALGRPVEYYDRPALRKITTEAAAQREPVVVGHSRNRQQHAVSVSDEGSRVMFITKKAISRRTLLRGIGTTLALPLLDGMVPALTALAKTAGNAADALRRDLRADGHDHGELDAEDDRRRLRADADSCSRSPRFKNQLTVVSGLDNAGVGHPGARQRVPDRRPRARRRQHPRRRVDGPAHRQEDRPGQQAAVARARPRIAGAWSATAKTPTAAT